MKYFLGADHAGIKLASFVKDFLKRKGHEVVCFLPQEKKVDYPDYAKEVCRAVLKNQDSRGILICGTGIGMSICANRFKGIRAALCLDAYMAKMTRLHNDANILCLGERLLGEGIVESILEAFVDTEFEGGRHLQRLEKIDEDAHV
ncbi:ribose 5-phosphate isomerase B [Helicobacter anatolicus]|uniref:ribose 5-phosphate isomerase B n=1 Tax=Helicobacter anatolicus TaxID=2905874 RepID=UPI001E290E93|nr:ribose 5-phosphate isomerase B [Helicobacter anatolicus]MCE3039389.1 ribose 5-phosphate isomerase B [Helicobacter anatolicus]